MCDTYYNATANDTDHTKSNGTFERETMFILPLGEAAIYNSPPRLNSTNNIIIEEDSGKVPVMYRVMWVGFGGKHFFTVWQFVLTFVLKKNIPTSQIL